MSKSFGTDIAVNWLRGTFPNEEIVLASTATVLETKSIAPVKWAQRVFERQATLILTPNRLILKNNPVSPITVVDALLFIASLSLSIISKNWQMLLLALLLLFQILLYLPYQRQLPYKDIRKVLLNPISDVRTELVVDIEEKVIHVVFPQTLPQKALKVLTSHAKTVVSS